MRHESSRAAFEIQEFGRGRTRARAPVGRPLVFADGHVEHEPAAHREARVLYAAGSIAVTSLQPLDLPARQTKFEQKVRQDKFVLERRHGAHWVTKGVTQPGSIEHALDQCRACPGVYRVLRQNKRGTWVEVRP